MAKHKKVQALSDADQRFIDQGIRIQAIDRVIQISSGWSYQEADEIVRQAETIAQYIVDGTLPQAEEPTPAQVEYADGSPVKIGEDGIPVLEDRSGATGDDDLGPIPYRDVRTT